MSGRDAHVARLAMAFAGVLCVSCEKRPQLLVIVDTDAVLGAQLLTDPTFSPDAAVDTVRIDRFDAEWKPICFDDVDCAANFVLPDPSLWPFSFGVASAPTGNAPLHLRIRLFRGSLATKGISESGDITIDPPTEATIDRLVEIPMPTSGEVAARILLSEDCLAVPVSFYKGAHTCVDGTTVTSLVAPSEGVDTTSGMGDIPTHAGTWARGRAVECGPGPQGDVVCIRGGFSFMGEALLAGIDEQSFVAATPPRPVYVGPFFMDRTEMTVGRFRAMVKEGLLTVTSDNPHLPDSTEVTLEDCTWLGESDESNDALPINCLSWSLAREACAQSGGAVVHGSLPTEAQWEHAARGRGQGRVYPWGDTSPECCTTSAGRDTKGHHLVPLCPGSGPDEVGARAPSPSCANLGDISRDGVLDLGGNVTEFCADNLVPYAEGCWSRSGIFVDPLCDDPVMQRSARGGNWASGPVNTRSSFREGDLSSATQGFRCVYPAGSP